MRLPVILAVATTAAAKASCLAGPELKHWKPEDAARLDDLIADKAHANNYAVFDMDQTSYRWDVEESLLPFLENKGVLTREGLDPELKVIPFQDTPGHNESLFSYYERLCETDDTLCYWLSAAVFGNIPLKQVKEYVDELLAYNGTIPATMFVDGVTTTVQKNRPVLYPGQQELYHRLMANGIAVYVLSASSEEIVRMIASDPQYGYNLPPENVIGVSLFLRNHAGDFTTARTLIEAGTYNASAMGEYWMTSVLQTPHTWITGKWAAILQYIDQWRLPVLVAGDTPKSDGPMIFHGIDRFDGIKLWVNRSASNLELINEMTANYSKEQEDLGLPVTADKGWLVVTPDNLLNLNGGS